MNESLRWLYGDSVEVMAPKYAVLDSRIFRVCRRAILRLPRGLSVQLSRLPPFFMWAELLSCFVNAGVQFARAADLADRLYDTVCLRSGRQIYSSLTLKRTGGGNSIAVSPKQPRNSRPHSMLSIGTPKLWTPLIP